MADRGSSGPSPAETPRSSVGPSVGAAPLAEEEVARFYQQVERLAECEMKVLAEDWTFLGEVNAMHAAKYSDLCRDADDVLRAVSDVKGKIAELPEYFKLIDDLDGSLSALESAAVKLDQYSRALEKRFGSQ